MHGVSFLGRPVFILPTIIEAKARLSTYILSDLHTSKRAVRRGPAVSLDLDVPVGKPRSIKTKLHRNGTA